MTSFILLSVSRNRISRLSVELLSLSLANGVESCARQYSSYSRILSVSSINRNLEKMQYEVRGNVAKRADKIKEDLDIDIKVCKYHMYIAISIIKLI